MNDSCELRQGPAGCAVRCAKAAEYVVYGERCARCHESRGWPECQGHAVCEFHAADLRIKEYDGWRDTKAERLPFVVARIHSLASSGADQ